ncbi:MAG: DNA mismatch repair endonuclease MutL [Desulfomonilaceae bacterium]|nr:DNA mismatch repair endonuclease MutL [Desulfomonilaceae bacterium]
MAGRIRVLDEKVINRIAAGEVVERPVSVMKELVENSIDAEATSIRLEIENGGKKLIRVRDNGTGMSHDDAFQALERHATSKLKTELDLVGIATMGFRGEALASIASVSRLTLMTREEADPAGTVITVEGGTIRSADRKGMAVGSMVEVRNLFFNVPVRRKFLKATATEAGHVHEAVTRFALAFPGVGFTYIEDGKLKMDAPAVGSTYERIYTLFSKDVRENLVEVNHSAHEGSLKGYVAKPPYARSNMRSVLTFVNGRSVKDRLINSAVTRGFANLMERGRYPFAILFIELPPDKVDVNVHPQKAEVRFVNPKQIYDLILDGVYDALTGAPYRVPGGTRREYGLPRSPTDSLSRHLSREDPEEAPRSDPGHSASPSSLPQDAATQQATAGGDVPAPATIPGHAADVTHAPRLGHQTGPFSSLGIVGRIPGSFVILHNDEELIVMDQHAAHERILFDDLVRSERRGEHLESQDLLIPQVIEFSVVEARALARHLGVLHTAGFRIEEFGEKDFVVKGVPSWFNKDDVEGLLSELVDVMLDTGVRGDPGRLREELLKSVACRTAVKESENMHAEEIRTLLKTLDRKGSPEVCPHGRPLMAKFPFAEIRRKLGRR